MRILLAEDQNEIRLLTQHQLERKGHHVVAVANGKHALDALKKGPFDVLLLDEDMPVMSGPQVLEAIRESRKESPSMMVIALTGYNSDPDRERLLNAGFDSVIGKPFRLDALESLLSRSSRSASALDAHKESEIQPAQSSFANLLDRIGGDEKLARKLIATFLRDTPQRMDGLQKALKRKNAESLASLAHALKGSVSIFDAVEAYDCALKLQDQGRANDLRGLSQVYDQLKEEIAKLEANLRGYAQKRSPNPGASPEKKRRSFNPNR